MENVKLDLPRSAHWLVDQLVSLDVVDKLEFVRIKLQWLAEAKCGFGNVDDGR